MNQAIKRKNWYFFDLEKEMQFLSQKLKEGYVLKDIKDDVYTFTETNLKGSYYIAYITEESQKAEFETIAEEVAQVPSSDFYIIHKYKRLFKNSFYRIDEKKGYWCYYFVPFHFMISPKEDVQRKHELYKQILKIKAYQAFMLILFMFLIFMPAYTRGSKGPRIFFTPLDLLEFELTQGNYFWAFIEVCTIIYLVLFPFILAYEGYQIYRYYRNFKYTNGKTGT